MPDVAALDRKAEARALATLNLAFSADPLARWVFPDPHQYLVYFPQLVQALGGAALDHSSAYNAGDFRGVSLWLPPGVHSDEEAAGAVLERGVSDELKGAAFSLLEQLGPYHPEGPHWYLSFIGVDPGLQGQGYGSALLRETLARTDEEHLPAYLESSNQRNIPLYERFGFKVMGEIRAGDSPGLWPMFREPR